MRVVFIVFLASLTAASAQTHSFECKGDLTATDGKKVEMKVLIDLNMKTNKGCAIFTPGGRGHHCFDFEVSENLYTLHNSEKKHTASKDMFGNPASIVTSNISNTVINRKTAQITVTNAFSDARSHRVISSSELKGECAKSKNNGLMTGNKL